MNDSYDLVIIGGSTGLMAAGFAVQLGARVALVEKHRLGGECTWTGCVPSKTLLKAAKVCGHGSPLCFKIAIY
jgi:pyruvate/2-oxoglutarate dehydrogenase complex dihydrolipoamide dehydrogenase (E3) component